MFKRVIGAVGLAAALTMGAGAAQATPFTETSPAGGAVPAGVSAVGGIVVDIIGTNGTRVVSQLAASSLFVGNASFAGDLDVGSQGGFDNSVTGVLGGGIAEAALRITLFDGDNQAGNFDFNDNLLIVNGLNFGNFSNVATEETDGTGTTQLSTGTGFGDGTLDTGWFYSADATLLTDFYNSLISTETVDVDLRKLDTSFQFYDFTQGVDASLIDVGSGPTTQPPSGQVSEPGVLGLIGLGLAGLALAGRRRRV